MRSSRAWLVPWRARRQRCEVLSENPREMRRPLDDEHPLTLFYKGEEALIVDRRCSWSMDGYDRNACLQRDPVPACHSSEVKDLPGFSRALHIDIFPEARADGLGCDVVFVDQAVPREEAQGTKDVVRGTSSMPAVDASGPVEVIPTEDCIAHGAGGDGIAVTLPLDNDIEIIAMW